jgi:hypothetical protein
MVDIDTQDHVTMPDRLSERVSEILETLTIEEIRQLASELEQETGESTE